MENAGLYFFSKNNDAYKPFNHLLYIKLKFLNEHFVTRRKVNVTHYFMIVERDIKLQKGTHCTQHFLTAASLPACLGTWSLIPKVIQNHHI